MWFVTDVGIVLKAASLSSGLCVVAFDVYLVLGVITIRLTVNSKTKLCASSGALLLS
jgi:hypothetical protein